MISTIGVHQTPHHQQFHGSMMTPNGSVVAGLPPQPSRRLLNLQFLDLTDCASLEDSGLKMIVESCPQLLYQIMRRCSNITGKSLHPFVQLTM